MPGAKIKICEFGWSFLNDSLNPDLPLLAAAEKLYGKKEFPEITYKCELLRPDKKGDISSPWAFSLNKIIPDTTPEEIACHIAAFLSCCQAENGFLNFTLDPEGLVKKTDFLSGRFVAYLSENKRRIVPDDEKEDFLLAFYLYRAAEVAPSEGFSSKEADLENDIQKRIAGMVGWCDILYEKKQDKALLSAVKVLAEQVYLWDRTSREDICFSKIFGAAGYFFSLCV